MTTSGAIAFAAPAFAATYSGRGDYTRQLDSVSLEATAAGRHLVYTKAACTAASISVELYQDFYFEPNTPLGRKGIACGKNLGAAWNSDDDGDHFLRFRSNDRAVTVEFTWTYPR